jgi:hypothetical protein
MTMPLGPEHEAVMREELGQLVRETWVAWASEQPRPKPSWLVPWEELAEPDREVDRRIGWALFREGFQAGRAAARGQQARVRAAGGLIPPVG